MSKRFLPLIPASLLAAGAAGLCMVAPTASGAPGSPTTTSSASSTAKTTTAKTTASKNATSGSAATSSSSAPDSPEKSCAALRKVQPEIDDLRSKAGSIFTPAASTGTGGTSKVQGVSDSLRKVGSELKSAEPGITDSPLHDSTDRLSQAVGATADYINSFANSASPVDDFAKLGSLGIKIGSATITYQMNYNRVCGNTPDDQQAPPSTSATPTKTTAPTPAKTTAPSPAKKPTAATKPGA